MVIKLLDDRSGKSLFQIGGDTYLIETDGIRKVSLDNFEITDIYDREIGTEPDFVGYVFDYEGDWEDVYALSYVDGKIKVFLNEEYLGNLEEVINKKLGE